MLQAIRERITGIVAIFVLGLLAVPFLFFGLESYIGGSMPQDAIATVGDQDIPTAQFQTEFARHRAQLRLQQGDAYDEIATNQPERRREFLEGMIDELLLRQHAEQLGLAITDGMMAELIQQIPNFQLGGEFNPELYRQALRASGLTARGFEQDVRNDLLLRMVPMALSGSAVITEAEIDAMLVLENERRRAEWIIVPTAPWRDQIEVSEADIEAEYQASLAEFMTPEQVRIQYVELRAADLTDGLTLDEEELRQRYEAARERFLSPELRAASHILLAVEGERDSESAQAQALSLREQILAGDLTFEAAAEAESDDPISGSQGGDLGLIEPGQMVRPFEDALYALAEVGELSEPVRSRFGWHLIRLDEVVPPQGLSFDEARAEILAEFIERESEGRYIEQAERLVDLIFADDTTLEPLAAELDLIIQVSEPFGRSGGEGLAANNNVVQAAFSDLVLLDGRAADPIEIDRNHMVVLMLDNHFPAQPRALAEVSDEVRERLIARRAAEQAKNQAEQLLAQWQERANGDFEALAEQAGLTWSEVQTVARRGAQHGADFNRQLFRLSAPDEAGTVVVLPHRDGFALTRLHEVLPGDPVAAQEFERQIMRQRLLNSAVTQELEGLLAQLRADTRIRVVEDRL